MANSHKATQSIGAPRGWQLAPSWLPEPDELHATDSPLWPADLQRLPSGELSVAGVRVTDLMRRYTSPLFVLSEAEFRARARGFREAFTRAFPDTEVAIYYAGKSFLCTEIVRWAQSEQLHLDVCTAGELAVAEHTSIPPSWVSLHGNNKSTAELERALDYGIGRIVVDSLHELDQLEHLAAHRGVCVPVMMRVTPGVHAHTHDYIATAHDDQKFGLSLGPSGALTDAEGLGSPAEQGVRQAATSPHIDLRGVHCHIGSQIFEASGFALAAERLIEFCAAMKSAHHITLEEIDLGGGYGIAYTNADSPLAPTDIASVLAEAIRRSSHRHDFRPVRLSFEPGRSIVGPSGFTLYTAGVVKDVVVDTPNSPAVRRYVSVDGGMSDNPRPVLYDADYTAVLASRQSTAEPVLTRVVGKHCESGDIVVRDVYLPGDLGPGDVLAVPATGAYCWSLASNYNYQPRPAVVAVHQGQSQLLVRAETETDLLRRDPGVNP